MKPLKTIIRFAMLSLVFSNYSPAGIKYLRPVAIAAWPGSPKEFVVMTNQGQVIRIRPDGRRESMCQLPVTRGGLTGLDFAISPSGAIFMLLADYSGVSAVGVCTSNGETNVVRLAVVGTFSSIAATDDQLVVASSRTGEVLFLSQQSLQIVRKQTVKAERISAIAYDPNRRAVIVADAIGGNVLMLPVDTHEGLVSTGEVQFFSSSITGLQSIAIDRVHGEMYAMTGEGEVLKVTSKGGQHIDLRTKTRAVAFAISSDGTVFATLDEEDTFSIFAFDGRLLFQVQSYPDTGR
jgi:hypothetical protein